MKKVLTLLLFISSLALGQANFGSPFVFPGVPSGICASNQLAINSSNGNLYSCNSGSWIAVNANGGSNDYLLNMVLSGPRVDWWEATGNIATTGTQMGNSGGTTGTRNGSPGSSTEPPYETDTTTLIDNAYSDNHDSQADYMTAKNPHLMVRAALSGITATRFLIGFTSSISSSDTMNGLHMAMFSYSTTRGDAKWQCSVGSGSGNELDTVSTATPDTNWHVFEISLTATTADFYIDRVHVCPQLGSNLPGSTTLMFRQFSVSCLACNPTAKTIKLASYTTTMLWP